VLVRKQILKGAMMDEKKYKEWWLSDSTDNSGWHVDEKYSHSRHYGCANVFHVVEASRLTALQAELEAVKVELVKRVDYIVEQGDRLTAANAEIEKLRGLLTNIVKEQSIPDFEMNVEIARQALKGED